MKDPSLYLKIKAYETVCRAMAPTREFDYAATLDDYDGAPDSDWQPVGRGETKAAAIADLLEQIVERLEERLEEEDED